MGKPHNNGKLPDLTAPYSEEAEEAVIGSILVNPEAFLDVAAFLKANDFYLIRHGYIWQAIERLSKRDEPLDYLTLMQELKDMGWLDDIGGPGYITRLINNTPTSMHATYYGRMVERAAKRRRLIALTDELKALALDESLDISAVYDKAESKLLNLVDDTDDGDDADVTLFDAIGQYMDIVERATANPDHFDGVPSSIPELNTALKGGYGDGQFIIFGGRPGMAKSSMLVAEAIHAARYGTTYLCTLEMTKAQVTGMILARLSKITPLTMTRGRMTTEEYKRFFEACRIQANAIGKNLILNDNASLTPAKLRRKIKKLSRKGLRAVFVDYAQLMDGGNEDDYQNRVGELDYISRSLKKIARKFNIPVIAAAQISRKVEQRNDKRPTLSDIRETGGFENDGDIVFGLYRDAYYNPITPPQPFDELEIIGLKGREIELRTIRAGFWGELKMIAPIETRKLEPEL